MCWISLGSVGIESAKLLRNLSKEKLASHAVFCKESIKAYAVLSEQGFLFEQAYIATNLSTGFQIIPTWHFSETDNTKFFCQDVQCFSMRCCGVTAAVQDLIFMWIFALTMKQICLSASYLTV